MVGALLAARTLVGWQVVAVALVIAGLVVAAVVEFMAHGRDLIGWAVVLVSVGVLLWMLAS